MANIRCGNCKQSHTSVEEVKTCYATKVAIPGLSVMALKPADYKPMATAKSTLSVPEAKYALSDLPGSVNSTTFFEVKYGKKNSKWSGYAFVSRLVGHPGDFQKFPVKGVARGAILAAIEADPQAAAYLFSKEFKVCARCGSPLSDDESRARGLGPDCMRAFA